MSQPRPSQWPVGPFASAPAIGDTTAPAKELRPVSDSGQCRPEAPTRPTTRRVLRHVLAVGHGLRRWNRSVEVYDPSLLTAFTDRSGLTRPDDGTVVAFRVPAPRRAWGE